MYAIDEILWLLRDGKWHSSRDIIEKSSIPKSKVEMVVGLLWEYGFIHLEKNGQEAKLCSLVLNFMDEIQRVERRQDLSHKCFEGSVGV